MLSGIVAADVNVLADVGRSSSSSAVPDAPTVDEVPEEGSVPRDEL